MIQTIRRSKYAKVVALFLAINFLFEIGFPSFTFALTGGPGQPEAASFTPIGTTDMVNLSTGDFSYNIPLLDIDGYPINISYQSGISMDHEASWVGLGWTLNPGAINRGLRGIPDDCKGDEVEKELEIKDNKTLGIKIGGGVEFTGIKIKTGKAIKKVIKIFTKGGKRKLNPSIAGTIGIFHNSYKGYGFEFNLAPSIATGDALKSPLNANLGLNVGFNSQEGIDLKPNLGLSTRLCKGESSNLNVSSQIGVPINSRHGLKTINVYAGMNFSCVGKNNNSISMANSGLNIPISSPQNTYYPEISMPMKNSSFYFEGSIGFELTYVNLQGKLEGYWSNQELEYNTTTSPSYGYLYSQEGQSDITALHDFNREKDGVFTENTPALPLTVPTYDIFNIDAQGVSGQFRAYRSDVGHFYDKAQTSYSRSDNIGIEAGIGPLSWKGAANYAMNNGISRSGKWYDGKVNERLSFKKSTSSPNYEPSYFKMAGEKSKIDNFFYSKFSGEEPVSVGLVQSGRNKATTITSSLPPDNTRNTRDKRNQLVSYLTAAEANLVGLDKKINSYKDDYFISYTNSEPPAGKIEGLERITEYKKSHHISEMTVTKPDGSRYVFGLPAYNNKQVEVSFAVGKNTKNNVPNHVAVDGVVTYDTGENTLGGNSHGKDNYFSKRTLPSYAHTYLLTAVLSPDYIDRTNNGVTDDDYGTATKLNYKITSMSYNWRVPYGLNTANYDEGFKSDLTDDKANYIYGEKELWYLHSIESRNYVAEFITEARHDALGVMDENGSKSTDINNKMQCLKKIVLYSKKDRILNKVNAVPVKTIEFFYDYSLCIGIPNNDNIIPPPPDNNQGGKLTLKSIKITYGKSDKGSLNSYKFYYPASTPGYALKGYDRWGNYKPVPTSGLTNSEFPYVEQDQSHADANASAWQLKKIELPSGGEINITYESDDYAYVQDKPAMQMVKVLGVGYDDTGSTGSILFDDNHKNGYNYIYFEKDPGYSIYEYVKDIKDIYFKFFIKLDPEGNEEFVPGYLQYDNLFGESTDHRTGWIKVKPSTLRDNGNGVDCSPISKAAWNFARLNTPQHIYKGSDPAATGESALKSLASFWFELKGMITGFNKNLRNKGFGKTFTPEKSWIRLYNPNGHKLGGGSRVQEIAISDRWDQMTTGGANYDHTQTFDYNLADGRSSGVAAYEPMAGGDENPCRLPVPWTDEVKLAPDNDHYMETPFGESFYPSASVGYSRVIVKNIPGDANNHTTNKTSGTGYVENLFYTAKDFPVITKQIGLVRKPAKPNWLNKIMRINIEDYMTASEGYVVITNDMHGKQKAQKVYNEGGSLISGVTYYYRSNGNKLNNTIDVVNINGKLEKNQTVGVEMDLISDLRKQSSNTNLVNVQVNLDFTIIPLPTLWMSGSQENTEFESVVITKHITKYGILEKTIAYDNGANITTENLALDAETGEVLLTRTSNEFDDPVYNFTYPAHWAYDGMGQAYKNTGITDQDYFKEGDEVLVDNQRGWVTSASPLTILDYSGGIISTSGEKKVIRSGRRNMQSVPVGSIVSARNPFIKYNSDEMQGQGEQSATFDINNVNTYTGIINTSAAEYYDKWPGFCKFIETGDPCYRSVEAPNNNPYVTGRYGNWYKYRDYTYLTGRNENYEASTGKTYARNMGTYSEYTPFWKYGSGIFNPFTDFNSDFFSAPKWVNTNTATIYDPYGNQLEEQNAMGIYSSAIFSYNNKQPLAVASNAQHREILMDNFEEYDYDHLLPTYNGKIPWPGNFFGLYRDIYSNCGFSSDFSHTGDNSLQVNAGNTFTAKFPVGENSIGNCCIYSHCMLDLKMDDDFCLKAKKIANGCTDGIPTCTPCNWTCSELVDLWNKVHSTESYNDYYCKPCHSETTCLPEFLPYTLFKKYLFSGWVRTNQKNITSYNDIEIVIRFDGTASPFVLKPKGAVIDGWQRVEGEFNLICEYNFEVTLKASPSATTYFDDIRIQPADAKMKTYVYDQKNIMLRAELDDNNYATFYEYDEEKRLVRIKKETERGIYTIQENKTHLFEKPE